MLARAISIALITLFPLQLFAQNNDSSKDLAELRDEVKALRQLVETKGVSIRLIDTTGWSFSDRVAGSGFLSMAGGAYLQAFGTTGAARTLGGYLALGGLGGIVISSFIDVIWPTPAKSDGIATYFLTEEGMNVFVHLNEEQMLTYAKMDPQLASAVRKINKAYLEATAAP